MRTLKIIAILIADNVFLWGVVWWIYHLSDEKWIGAGQLLTIWFLFFGVIGGSIALLFKIWRVEL